MAVTQQSELQEIILQALEEARKTSHFVLVSQVREVEKMDPLDVFATGKDLDIKHRMLWTEPVDSLTYAGLGSTYTIKIEETDRFKGVEDQWKRLMKNRIVDPEYKIPFTGPVLLGGFSFDPLKKKSNLWTSFPDSNFVLPTFLYTSIKNKYYLTTNLIVNPNDTVEKFNQIIEQQEFILNKRSNNRYLNEENDFVHVDEIDKDNWIESVEEVATEIQDGHLDKVVLARELRIENSKPFSVEMTLQRLRREQPTSYLFAFENDGTCFLGASPERLIKRTDNEFLSTCLAGSIARGKTAKEDDHLGEILLNDEKNLLEHKVVVRMIKHAMEKCCEEVLAPDEPNLYKVRDIQHLYTPVVGKAKKGVSLLEMVKQLHPTPALGGYPKKAALQKIRQVESMDRGWYAAPVGWIDEKGNGEFAVAIRSGLIKNKQASLFAGCGIVGDSDPISEYKETKMKFRPMLSAIGGLENDGKW